MKLQTILSLIFLAGSSWFPTAAQEPATPPAAVEKTPEALRDDQLAISGRYARFERMLSQMADILGRQDPERADLLRRAIGRGREDRISEDIEKIVGLLEKHELGGASEQQAEVIESLQVLLKLLQSGPANGLEITQRIPVLSKDTLSVNYGSLYPALHRLEARGWIRNT